MRGRLVLFWNINGFFFKSLLFTELYTSSAVFMNYCAFQKHANSDVQSPTDPFALPSIFLADLLGNRTLL